MRVHGMQPMRKLAFGGHGNPVHDAFTAQSGAPYTIPVDTDPMLASSAKIVSYEDKVALL